MKVVQVCRLFGDVAANFVSESCNWRSQNRLPVIRIGLTVKIPILKTERVSVLFTQLTDVLRLGVESNSYF